MDIAFQPKREKAKFWRAPEYHNMELLSATYIKQKFSHHYHETYAIGVVEQGIEKVFIGGIETHVMPGEMILINPNVIHSGEAGDERGWKYRMFYPSVALLRQLAQEISGEDWHQPHFPMSVVDDPIVARQLSHLHRVLEKSDNQLKRDTAMRIAFGSLILRHAENNPLKRCTQGERDAVRRVREYIETYYEHNTSLDELAEIAGLSPFHLVRVFKDETGLPPHTYLTHVRVQKARELLQNDPLSIADVAYATGFTDQSHLTRWFKRMVGVTPGKYVAV